MLSPWIVAFAVEHCGEGFVAFLMLGGGLAGVAMLFGLAALA